MDPTIPPQNQQPSSQIPQEPKPDGPHEPEEQHTEHPHHVSNKPIVVALLLLAVVFLAGIYYFTVHPRPPVKDTIQDQAMLSVAPTKPIEVDWEFDGEQWKSSSTPPACQDPIVFDPLVDLSLVSAVLYPGQVRGEDYKPHGGFIFGGRSNEEILVRAPMDARLIAGSRYVEQGEVQYLLSFVNSCGIAYRFDHLLTLAPEIQKIADTLPQPVENDSRLTKFASASAVKKGDPIATSVGFKNTRNVTVDFGVYDLRKQNPSASDAAFAQFHADEKDQAYYALCWLELFPADQVATIKAFPGGDPIVGKASDFCKQ